MTLQRVIPLTFVAILISFILFADPPPFKCFDPAGCILLQPGEFLSIGITRVSSGPGQKTSLEIQQSAELAINQLAPNINYPSLSIQPFFAPCLSESASGSSVDAASSIDVIATIGSGCPTDTVDFNDRMARAAIMGVSASPFTTLNSNSPDDQLLSGMAQQAALIISSREYQSVFVVSSTDLVSIRFRDIFCEAITQKNIICYSDPDTFTFELIHPEAQILISLDSEIQTSMMDGVRIPETPTFFIALSRPQVSGDVSRDGLFWIAPNSWADGEFLKDYLQTYQTVPESLEARITYDSMPFIITSLQETSRPVQGGRWIVSRHAFQQSLAKNIEDFRNSAIYDCHRQAICILTPLSLFQLNGNEYKLDKP